MTFGQLLGLIAVIIGFISAVISETIFGMNPLEWYVLAIALVMVLGIGAIVVPGVRKA